MTFDVLTEYMGTNLIFCDVHFFTFHSVVHVYIGASKYNYMHVYIMYLYVLVGFGFADLFGVFSHCIASVPVPVQ